MDLKLVEFKKFLKEDKRKEDRLITPLNMSFTIQISMDNSSQKWLGSIIIENINGGGLRFSWPKKMKKEEDLNLKIDFLDDSEIIFLSGEVVWCELMAGLGKSEKAGKKGGYSIGLKFHKMKHADRRKFVRFISENVFEQYFNNFRDVLPA
ncbi:PilZ domain-containing protein [Candidatus Pacearchaeota archaeon]|nr:PilZ domain-containing protein [Candidatus Pacearchaeota archaeon]